MKKTAAFLFLIAIPWLATGQEMTVTNGLKVWLKADAISGLSHGQAVTEWPDSAAGFILQDGAQNATGSVGTAIYITNAVNQKPAVVLSNAALAYSGSLNLNTNEGAQAFTVFVVGRNENASISPAISFGDVVNGVGDGGGGSCVKCDVSAGAGSDNSGSGIRWNDGRRVFSGGNFSTSQFRIGFWRMDVGSAYSNAVYKVDNGNFPQTGLSAGDRTINLLDEGYYVGAGINGATKTLNEFMNGAIAEVLLYTRALSDAEANNVGFYLERKYGLDTAYVQQGASNGPPNVMLILFDDMGFSDLGCYGGDARTPNIDSLAASGLCFRNFHNTARCSPTRMSLLTGLYTHQAATIPGDPLPPLRTDNNVTMAEVLSAAGYRTYMAGKWHLGSGTGQTPRERGFEHVFGTGSKQAGSGADFWKRDAYSFSSENGEISPRTYGTNAYEFYATDAIGDYALDFLNHHFSKGDDRKFFMFLPFNAPHFDMQANKTLVEYTPAGGQSYLSIYSQGWDIVRSNRYHRMLSTGVINPLFALSPLSDTPYNGATPIQPVPAWSTLGANRKADLARRMALYTAMIEQVDKNVGRVIGRLTASGQLDNTLIFILSDNGANAEGGKFGWARTGTEANKSSNHAALTGEDLAEMGQPFRDDGISIGGCWANVGNTPFRMYKRFSNEGGIRTPLIVHWPEGMSNPGRWTDQAGHLIDVMRTVVEVTGATYPNQHNGHPVLPMEGRSMAGIFQGQPEFSRTLGFEHESTRAWIDGNWKLVTKTFANTDGSSLADTLELYNVALDPTELNNLAPYEPALLVSMVEKWNAWAARVGVPAGRLLPSPFNPTPASNYTDLFLDTFSRTDNVDADASANGMSGSRGSLLGAGATYYEGFEGTGVKDSIHLFSGRMRLAYGNSMAENGIMHNFVGQDIVDAGGFSVSMHIADIDTTTDDPANRYAGFGVGLSQAEASSGSDISGSNSFRGSVNNPVGKADCFVELDIQGNVKVWSKGQLLESVQVGKTNGTLTASYTLNGFGAGDPVTLNVFFNGRLIDINHANAASTSQSFTWDNSNANYIGLSARATGFAEIDNLAIRKLPLAPALASEYALRAGLTLPDSALDADPDRDADHNFQEWLKGGNPVATDGFRQLLAVYPASAGQFRFSYHWLKEAEQAGVAYAFRFSTNLVNWTAFSPEEISSQTDASGYESVEARIPIALTAFQPVLFILLEASGLAP